MRISILAIGRLGRGPEADLVSDYAERATATGRALAMGPLDVVELDPRRPGKAAEAEALAAEGIGAILVTSALMLGVYTIVKPAAETFSSTTKCDMSQWTIAGR